jgi:hypothetical protein
VEEPGFVELGGAGKPRRAVLLREPIRRDGALKTAEPLVASLIVV